METAALEALGANNILQEVLGPRADSADGKNKMYSDITKQGYVYLKDLPNDINKKKAVKTASYDLLSAGITNDLMEPQDVDVDIPTINIDID